jgi:hypothetical protein
MDKHFLGEFVCSFCLFFLYGQGKFFLLLICFFHCSFFLCVFIFNVFYFLFFLWAR